MSKLIVIEGIDCSGKQTQVQLLKIKLEKWGYKVFALSFPNYESPTGKIIGGPYLGKKEICDGWFKEGATNVDAKTSSMFFALDRYYNLNKLKDTLKEYDIILLDRYTYSAMAHQGGKLKDFKSRLELYQWIEKLEFEMLNLPKPNIVFYLHMPLEEVKILKQKRKDLDDFEKDEKHLENAQQSYKELANIYSFKTIECIRKNKANNEVILKEPLKINEEIWKIIQENIK